eukprot:4379236-Prorocentrum_lima.AAC.1
MKSDLEFRYGWVITAGHCIWPWFMRYSGWLVSRFAVGADGRTAYKNINDVIYNTPLVPFAET